jgi:hypothetical protein
MSKNDFENMSIAERGMIIMNKGNHLTQVKQNEHLLNLYTVNDFFVEVYYSLKTNQIDKIDIISDFSRIDLYIDENLKKKKLHSN